ncbi:MAG: efflux RND transporter periplasmic adaptor subunit [Candidatus Acidiferrales bacterium]
MAEPNINRSLAQFLRVAFLPLVVASLVVLSGCGRDPDVQVVQVSRDNLQASITSNGKVEPINPFVFRAAFPTFVLKVIAAEGQAVRKGQTILTLDAADVESQLAAARSNLLTAKSDLLNARSGGPPDEVAQIDGDLRKTQAQVANLEQTQQQLRQLYAKQATTQAELDKNALELETARAVLQTLQQKKDDLVHRAALDVDRLTFLVQQESDLVRSLETKVRSALVIAPVNGTLYSLPVHAGDYVAVGQELAQIADLRKVQVRAFVDEPDLGGLAPDQEVRITWDAMPNREWSGRIEQIPKQVVAHGTRSVGEVLCSVDNDKLELLPNTNVSVWILEHARRNVLSVSRAAVRSDGPHRYVFFVDDGRLRRKEISVGIASASKYEILSGLSEGDRVAIPGDVDLKDGMSVRVTNAK